MSTPNTSSTSPSSDSQKLLQKLPALVTILLVLGGILWIDQFKTKTVKENEPINNNPSRMNPVGETDHIRGNKDTPYTLIEYGDIAC